MGALAELVVEPQAEPVVRLSGVIAAPDGSPVNRAQMTGAVGDGDALGRRLAHMLLAPPRFRTAGDAHSPANPAAQYWPMLINSRDHHGAAGAFGQIRPAMLWSARSTSPRCGRTRTTR
ncbi:MAG TPA: hypothetical protein VK735_42995 [Pseudonocardia sp.]|uniref:hypothetical protein n=1 Tax=Pseudonocardia sp. TaxID=60912 RepID=UPI002CED1D16|nr:hypothetical protein [Pseudonocardia sp.]HTF54256.1 hypothetical protein [Pseudonocardia sp.]